MPPGGVHLAAGIGVLRCGYSAYQASKSVRCKVDNYARRWFPLLEPLDRGKALTVGFIMGCILPDADLLLCITIGAFSNIEEEDLKVFHRTFSHSLLVVPAIASVLVVLLNMYSSKRYGKLTSFAERLGLLSQKQAAKLKNMQDMYPLELLTCFILGATLGCILHSFLDLFYCMKLQILWPIPFEFGLPLLFPLDLISEREKKLLMVGDFACDALFWYIPMCYFCFKYKLHLDKLKASIFLILSYACWLSIFVQDSWISDTVSTVTFTRRLYILGTIWVVLLKLSPCVFHEVIMAIVTEDPKIEWTQANKDKYKKDLGILIFLAEYLIT